MHSNVLSYILCLLMLAGMFSCSATKYVPDDSYLLQSVAITSEDKTFPVENLYSYIRQHPNSKWFSTFKVPLAVYSLSGRDTTRWINRTLKKIGEAPVVYDTLQEKLSISDINMALYNMGRLHSQVDVERKIADKCIRLNYIVKPGQQYMVDSYSTMINDTALKSVLGEQLYKKSLIAHDKPFSINALNGERQRITKILLNNGYYKFNKEFIHFDVDTIAGDTCVNVTMSIQPYKTSSASEELPHPQYFIRNVSYRTALGGRLRLRRSVLDINSLIEPGRPFSAIALERTYNNFSRLGAVSFTNIKFDEVGDSLGRNMLDCDVLFTPAKRHSISFRPEGTNTAGNLGAAVAFIYENRNPFWGSELLTLELRGAFEAITGLEGYNNENYKELGAQVGLTIPRMVMPFLIKEYRQRFAAQTEITLAYNLQNRPEFHRRLTTAALRYKWGNPSKPVTFRLDLLDLNYIYMPWISAKFKSDYLDNADSRNAILKYNYDDIFIMKLGFRLAYAKGPTAFKANIETAGNLLRAASGLFNAQRNQEGSYTLFNIAYAQYAKVDLELTHLLSITQSSAVAMHLLFGVAYPYGNSDMLPFEKRYFAGGANSVRGWNVRELGPGAFRGTDGRIDFMNRTGDIKLDASIEFRSHLLWKFQGAAFIDAGNIWTIKKYVDQPDGEFRFDKFYKQLAASYGLGLRLNLDYFVVRFDFAMKAVNPAYDTKREHYPLFHPDMSRDFSFHFAVGMPF